MTLAGFSIPSNMSRFTKELDELQSNGVITPEIADRIRAYYKQPNSGNSRMMIAFGIIGALLVGMGIVLIIAHNWDNLSDGVKLLLGFAPLVVAQVIAGFLIVKQSSSKAWTESTAVILIFAIATSISVVSQVYNIHGNLGNFLLAWTVLSLPVIYLLRSWVASLLYWIGITWYATEVGYSFWSRAHLPGYYWLLALAALPFYIGMIRQRPNANAIAFHNWFIAISLVIVLPLGHGSNGDELLIGAYMALFSSYIIIGQLPYFASRKLISNAFLVGGSAGTIILLLFLTFEWPELGDKTSDWWMSSPLFAWIILFVIASGLLFRLGSTIGYRNILSKSYTFLIFLVLFAIGLSNPVVARGLTNVIILALGVFTIREGAQSDKLWKMNYGLLILSVLIICRFFDTDMSFVIRGLLFVAIGLGFFGTNFYMMKKRKSVA